MVGGLVCAARAGVAGDEDSIAAFFLTIADEQTQSEFCKSDPAVAAVACDTLHDYLALTLADPCVAGVR